MKVIYKRELGSYFQSMIGYVFIAFLTAVTGVYFMAYNLNYGYPYFSYALSGVLFVMIIAVPVLTMKCFAEERKSKSDQLLLTAPVSLFGIVSGKYLAMVTVFAIPNAIFCIFPLIIKTAGNAYLKEDYASILVFFLLGCVYIAIGMFLSALTESQIIAAVTTFAVLLLIFLWDSLMNFLPTSALSNAFGIMLLWTFIVYIVYHLTKNWLIAAILEAGGIAACLITYFVKSSLLESFLPNMLGKLSLYDVFSGIASNHYVDISGIFLYLSIIAVFMFLTMQAIQKRRWS